MMAPHTLKTAPRKAKTTFSLLMTAPNSLKTVPENVKDDFREFSDMLHSYGVALHPSAFYLFTLLPFYFSAKDINQVGSSRSAMAAEVGGSTSDLP